MYIYICTYICMYIYIYVHVFIYINMGLRPIRQICQATIIEILKIGTRNLEIVIFLVFPIPGKLGFLGRWKNWKMSITTLSNFPKFRWKILVFGKCAIFGSLRFLIICPFCGREFDGFEFYSKFSAAARVNSVRRTHISGAIFPFWVSIVSILVEWSWISSTCKLRFDAPACRVRFWSFWSASSAWSWIGHGFRVSS